VVYDPETNEPTLCDCAKDIPEGFLHAPVPEEELVVAEVFKQKDMDAAYKKGFADGVATGSKTKIVKKSGKRKSAAKKDDKADKEDKPEYTLKGLKLSADDAMDLLEEEKIEFGENATDDQLAALVGELLKDDKSE